VTGERTGAAVQARHVETRRVQPGMLESAALARFVAERANSSM
jgi:hypothetical protein